MEKLKMHSPNLTQDNIARIRDLFPGCVTEARDSNGSVKLAVDFDQLRQELTESIVEGAQERYQLNWPGKREALLRANAPIAKTLRPCREESVDFETTRNLFIEGDNLEALKLLQETYLGKVKLIYIDPPYNTGNDFVYEDDFAESADEYLRRSGQKDDMGNRLVVNTVANGRFHSDWASMIYSRLKIARSLLADDGLIFISIDDGEVANLRSICGEIFGEDNFVAQLIWKKSYGGGAKSKHVVRLHEYVLVYARQKESLGFLALPPNEDVLRYYKFKDDKFDLRGPYRKQPLATNSMDPRPNLRYAIVRDGEEIWPEKQWQWSKDRVAEALKNDELVFTKKGDGWTVDYKQYLKDEEGVVRGAKPYTVLDGPYTQRGTSEIEQIFGNGKVFTFPKPSELIEEFLGYCGDGGLVLDFFAGSCPTAHAVLRKNATQGTAFSFIVVQYPETCDPASEASKAGYATIAEIGKERIRRCGVNALKEASSVVWNRDIGFRVLKIDTSNMADVYYDPDTLEKPTLDMFVDNIKPDRTPEDLLFQVMIDWGVDLALPISKQAIQGKDVFLVDGNALAACFDGHGGVDEEFVKELAKVQPLRVVFRDAGFKDSSVKINVEQIFKLLSPATEVKCI